MKRRPVLFASAAAAGAGARVISLSLGSARRVGAASAAAFYLPSTWSRAIGANDDIRVAIIGCNDPGKNPPGGRGRYHMKEIVGKIKKGNSGLRLTAICDVDQSNLDSAKAELEKNDIKAAAEKLEAESTDWDKQSDAQLHLHHRWAQATTGLQVSIALAAIALLTKKKWLEYAMFGAGAAGVLVGALAVFHI